MVTLAMSLSPARAIGRRDRRLVGHRAAVTDRSSATRCAPRASSWPASWPRTHVRTWWWAAPLIEQSGDRRNDRPINAGRPGGQRSSMIRHPSWCRFPWPVCWMRDDVEADPVSRRSRGPQGWPIFVTETGSIVPSRTGRRAPGRGRRRGRACPAGRRRAAAPAPSRRASPRRSPRRAVVDLVVVVEEVDLVGVDVPGADAGDLRQRGSSSRRRSRGGRAGRRTGRSRRSGRGGRSRGRCSRRRRGW